MMEPRYKAVIFDLDGTLLNTLDDIANACNEALCEAGCQAIENTRYQQLVGYGVRNLVETAVREHCPDWTADQIEPVYQSYCRKYGSNWHIRTDPYPGIKELLARLKAAGVLLAVLSNKPHDTTQMMIQYYFDPGLFASCYGQLEPYPTKPNPELALAIASELGVEPAAIALVGDSGSDMKTAVNAQMTGIGALWGFREAAELLGHGAAVLVRDAEELGNLVLGD